jgi:predicted DNA-binding WGR domain protein
MPVEPNQLNKLQPLSSSLARLDQERPAQAANEEHAHIAEELLPQTDLRRTDFVAVSNLHQGDALRHQFTRVPLTADQIKDDLGEGLYKLFDFQQPVLTEAEQQALDQAKADGKPVPHHITNRLQIPEALSKDKLKHNDKFQRGAYQALHEQLKDSEAVHDERGKRSVFQKFKDFFVGDRRASLNIAVDGRDDPDTSKLTLKLSIDGKEISQEAKLHHRADYQKKSGIGWRKAAYGVGMGALIVGGAASIVVVGGLLAAVGGGLAIAGGLYMAGKLAFGKHPWWGKTVTGQLQRAEREHARTLADGIAGQVKATMMVDAGKRNVDGEFQARHILQDAEALQNFIRLAKEKNASRLYNDIRAKLLEEASSPLSSDTITRAKKAAPGWKVWSYLFKGAPGKHANKTVDIYAKELTMGIMRGVNEAYVQSLIGELSDHVTNQGQSRLVEILGQGANGGGGLMHDVTNALQFLNPNNNADRFPIADPEKHITALQAMLGDQVVGPEAGTVDRAIALVNQSGDILGEVNTRNLSAALGTLKTDLESHIASLQDVNQLLSQQGEDAVSLDTVNDKLAALLADGFDSAADAEAATQALEDELGRLLARINDPQDPNAGKLVKAHAEQLVALLAQVRTAIKDAGEHATTIAGAEAAFSSADLTLTEFRTQATRLRELDNKVVADLNPSGRSNSVPDAMNKAEQQRKALLERCDKLVEADKRAEEIKAIRDQAVAQAANGDLHGALALESSVADRHRAYGELTASWTGADYALPGNLSALDVAQWKREVTAAYLKLDAPTADLAPVLDQLASGSSEALETLRQLSGANGPNAVRNLLTELQKTLPAADADAPAAAQHAINALRVLDKAIVDENGTAAATVARALHPAQAKLIGTYRAVETLDKASRTAKRTIGAELAEVNAEAAGGRRAPGGDDAADFLQQLAQFCANRPGSLTPEDLASLQASATMFTDGAGSFADWGADAQRIAAFDREQVSRLLSIFNGLIEDDNPLRAAITNENEMRLARLAVVRDLAAEIAAGAQNSASPALQAAVQLSSAPKAGVSRAELESAARQLLDAYIARSTNASEQRLKEADLKELAEQLATQVGFKGTAQALIQRIANQPAVQRLLRRHITAHLALNSVGQKPLPTLAADMSDKERLDSARTLAGFAPARSSALEQLSADGKHAVRSRVEARDKLSARFRKSDAEVLGDKQLARKLRNAQTREAVERFALEERVFSFLKEAIKTEASLKTIRIAIEESGADVENAQASLPLLRQQSLDHANHITGYVEKGIRARLTAIQELVDSGLYDAIPLDDQNGSLDPKLAYLGAEIVRLQQQLNSLDQVAEALKKPAEHDLAAIGRMIREADAVANESTASIKLAYIKAQQTETAQALKYFNIRNFSVQSPSWGFLGQLYFRLFNQNAAKLSRVVGREDARAIADSISLIAKNSSLSESLSLQKQQLEKEITALEARKQAMVNDESKVRSALVLVTLEQLAESSGDEITDSMRASIINDWKALLGNEAINHADLINKAGDFKDLETLVKRLGVQQDLNQQIGREYEAVRTQQRQLEAKGRQLRENISKSALEAARNKQAQTLELAQDLGLEEADFVTLTSLVGESAAKTLVDLWQQATDSRDRGDRAEAWARASAVAMLMESEIENKFSKVDSNEQKRNRDIGRRLIDKLEREFMQDLPTGTPRLDSITRTGSPAERGHTLSARGYALSAQASKLDGITNVQQKAREATKLREAIEALEEEVKQSLQDLDLLNGQITDTRPLSRRALQRLGVEAQLYLAIALRRLFRNTEPVYGEPSLEIRAKYHSYNAGMVRQALASQAGSGASTYSPGDVSSYEESLQALDRELVILFGTDAKKLNAETLVKLQNQATGALDVAIDEGEEDNRDVMEGGDAQLTSAMIEGPKAEKKPGVFKRFLGLK